MSHILIDNILPLGHEQRILYFHTFRIKHDQYQMDSVEHNLL